MLVVAAGALIGDAAAGHHAKVADVADVHVGSPQPRYSRTRRHSDVVTAGRRVGQGAGS
jgi:predicted RecB family endonuclease